MHRIHKALYLKSYCWLTRTHIKLNETEQLSPVLVTSWYFSTLQGSLCGEPLRGVRFDIHDVKAHQDPACRKGAQVIPTARRVTLASQLTAKPRMMEPVYLVEIQVRLYMAMFWERIHSTFYCYLLPPGRSLSQFSQHLENWEI